MAGHPRRIFAERVPKVAATYARTTCRLAEVFESIAFACGGEAGARLAERSGMPTSPDTLLRRIRGAPLNRYSTPQVLGVDEWAVRRGQWYGTILCDLERCRPVDLLDERSAASFSAWLPRHPGVQIICRDRAGCYSQGANSGAPHAMQVADRWHLLYNLDEALVRMLDRHHRPVREAARVLAPAPVQRAPPTPENPTPQPPRPATPAQQLQQARRARRVERYEQVMELHHQGLSQRAIARRVGLNRETVARYVRADGFPERASRPYRRRIDAFAEYLHPRWIEGCRNAAQLARELRAQGFDGSYLMVHRYIARRRGADQGTGQVTPGSRQAAPVVGTPSSKRVARMLLKNQESLTAKERAFVGALRQRCPDVRRAAGLAREFVRIVHRRRPEGLERWIARARNSRVPHDLRSFARVLKSDYAAVHAALTLDWSNGHVEGQINRLKLIKRQMYGRANFDLLRQRVLYTG